MTNNDKRYVTVSEHEKKNAFMYSDVKRDMDKVNARIDKYADKQEILHDCVNDIKVNIAEILAYQKSNKASNGRILKLLTDGLRETRDDVKDNRRKINYFSGGAAVLGAVAGILWSALKGS